MANEILKRDENHEPVIGLVTDDANEEIRMGRIDDTTKGLKVMFVGGVGMGTVTNVATGTGLTGGPITTTGTISLDSKLAPLDTLGTAGQSVRVNAGATALEYYTPSVGTGTVTSVAALTLGTTGTDLSSTVANSTTTPVITLQVPTASATNRGALSSTDWTTFNNKLSSLSGALLATGTVTGATAQSQVFTLGATLSNMTLGSVLFAGTAGVISQDNNTFFWDNTNKNLGVGTKTFLSTGNVYQGYGTSTATIQGNVQNASNGTSASSDWIATADTGTNSTNYIDMGINSSTYSDAAFNINNALGGYLYNLGGDLSIGTGTAAKVIKFHTGGTTSTNLRATISDTSFTVPTPGTTTTCVATVDATQTLTNKRISARVYSTTTLSTLTPEKDTYDIFTLTAQSGTLTIANKSTTTYSDGDQIRIRIYCPTTIGAITFGTDYVAKGGNALPTTTILTKNMELGFEYNASLGKMNLLALAIEA